MPTVTRLVVRRRSRVRVFIDGEFWAELDDRVAVERGIFEGEEFSREELAEARLAGELPLAMGRALNVLGYRARSEGEIRTRLSQAGFAATTVEAVVGRLLELGYLDDEEFARSAAREKARRYGPRRVFSDLRRSRVGEELAREAVEAEFPGDSELEAAISAARQRYNKSERSDAVARRVHGFLARRGYSIRVCAVVAREYRRPEARE